MKFLSFNKKNDRITIDYTSVKSSDPNIKWNRRIQHFTLSIHNTGEIYQFNAHYDHYYDYNKILLLDAISLLKLLKEDEDNFYCYSVGNQVVKSLFKENNPFI